MVLANERFCRRKNSGDNNTRRHNHRQGCNNVTARSFPQQVILRVMRIETRVKVNFSHVMGVFRVILKGR